MGYIITDGNTYLDAQSHCVTDPYIWKKERSAENVIKAWQSRKKKPDNAGHYQIFHVSDVMPAAVDVTGHTGIADKNCMEIASAISRNMQLLAERKAYILAQYTETEHEIVDAQHLIELLPPLSAAKGYQMYKNLRDLLKKRRELKDELMLFATLTQQAWNPDFYEALERQSDGMKHRIYEPRSSGPIAELVRDMENKRKQSCKNQNSTV